MLDSTISVNDYSFSVDKYTKYKEYKVYPPQVKYNTFYRMVWRQVHKENGNFIALLLGKPGTGKSYGALGMAYDLDRNNYNKPVFNVWKQIYFSIDELMDGLENADKPGTVHILDESGINEALQSRNFMSLENKLASSLFQTMRFQKQIVFVVAPSGIMIDKQVKVTTHADIIFIGHNKEKSWAKVKIHDDDLWKGDEFRKYPQTVINGERYQWRVMHFAPPPRALVDSYEWIHTMRKDAMRDKWKSMVDSKREKEAALEKTKASRLDFNKAYKMVSGVSRNEFEDAKGKMNIGKLKAFFAERDKVVSNESIKQIAKALE